MEFRKGGSAAISERSCHSCNQGDHRNCWRYQAYVVSDQALHFPWSLEDAIDYAPMGIPWCSCYEYKHELHPLDFYED